jgi:hypothetical protein
MLGLTFFLQVLVVLIVCANIGAPVAYGLGSPTAIPFRATDESAIF